ncbi:MAG: H4MPT-linked C1 transfer pathway protein [Planctomycetota bacterium]|nr:MAG: H4MPT-linked C1 transfer pathway protein [Planctomycetota bacterium]
MTWLALDIGGANLKAADGLGFALARPFALWRRPEQLAAQLRQFIGEAPPASRIAVTMTGELADCYPTKAEGVRSILEALDEAAAGRRLAVYRVDGRFVPPDEARQQPLRAAASNWRALAAFANRFAAAWPALLLDLGSTTADVIPLDPHGPCTAAQTDVDRLLSGELVYTGVERTPVAAVVRTLPFRGRPCPVAAEFFATAADAYLLLGDLPAAPADCDTADGQPRTLPAAHARMARMFCGDAELVSRQEAITAAAAVRDAQLSLLESALRQVAARLAGTPRTVIISGHGEFLLRRLLERTFPDAVVLSLKDELGAAVSRCASAHALAVLAREGFGKD